MSPPDSPRSDKENPDERPVCSHPVEEDLYGAEGGRELIRQPTPIGEGKRDMRISQIQEQVGRGEYQVDTQAVADAILRRLLEDYKGISFPPTKRGPGDCP